MPIHEFKECGRHFLTEDVPKALIGRPKHGPSDLPDRDALALTADQRLQSLFLWKLPLELRQRIYKVAWQMDGPARHIFVEGGRFAHAPCVTDHDAAEDERQVTMEKIWADRNLDWGTANPRWARRFISTWGDHWKCEEALMGATAAAEGRDPVLTPFLTILLTCKQM
jgi:hypothetical protein